MIVIPEYIKQFALLCKDYTNIYIVGGFVRDSLLNKTSNDIDLCGYLQVEELQQILLKSKFKIDSYNKTFGTAKIIFEDKLFEYTTFRRDTYTGGGKHTPSKVEFVKDIFEDAGRRDFTINCIYYDILEEKLFDPFNGLDDLKNKVIRTVLHPSKTLSVDGERLLRLIKLKVNYNLNVDRETLENAIKYKDNIKNLNSNIINKFLDYLNLLSQQKLNKAKELLVLFDATFIIDKF